MLKFKCLLDYKEMSLSCPKREKYPSYLYQKERKKKQIKKSDDRWMDFLRALYLSSQAAMPLKSHLDKVCK